MNCDLIVHVIDASNPHASRQRQAVLRTLNDLRRLDESTITSAIEVHNKADRLTEQQRREWAARHRANNLEMSELLSNGEGRQARCRGDQDFAHGDKLGSEGGIQGSQRTHADVQRAGGPSPLISEDGLAILLSAHNRNETDGLVHVITRRLRAASPRRRYALRINNTSSTVSTQAAQNVDSSIGEKAGFEHLALLQDSESIGSMSGGSTLGMGEDRVCTNSCAGSAETRRLRACSFPVSATSVSTSDMAAEQLAFLHSHPTITIITTRAAADGVSLLVDVEMDELAYQTFVGRWGCGVLAAEGKEDG
mmetsp:Transcript_29159/g.79641  ORF Transcript_29159/g.79641 Transcript_29159/m.79641 type:complete len:308 (-) Transcript_29159:61-984(-)|eukprot:scaffold270834_cov28-Tisochrysis_lutea.AAC.1